MYIYIYISSGKHSQFATLEMAHVVEIVDNLPSYKMVDLSIDMLTPV